MDWQGQSHIMVAMAMGGRAGGKTRSVAKAARGGQRSASLEAGPSCVSEHMELTSAGSCGLGGSSDGCCLELGSPMKRRKRMFVSHRRSALMGSSWIRSAGLCWFPPS